MDSSRFIHKHAATQTDFIRMDVTYSDPSSKRLPSLFVSGAAIIQFSIWLKAGKVEANLICETKTRSSKTSRLSLWYCVNYLVSSDRKIKHELNTKSKAKCYPLSNFKAITSQFSEKQFRRSARATKSKSAWQNSRATNKQVPQLQHSYNVSHVFSITYDSRNGFLFAFCFNFRIECNWWTGSISFISLELTIDLREIHLSTAKGGHIA